MARLLRREPRSLVPAEVVGPVDLFGDLDRAFARMFGDWPATFPMRRPATSVSPWLAATFIPVDEFERDGSLVVRAELPGIDPEKNVDVTVEDGMLHILARRHEEESVEDGQYFRKEIRHGSFERVLPLPEGVREPDVKATYRDGILEIVVPLPEAEPAKKIDITTG